MGLPFWPSSSGDDNWPLDYNTYQLQSDTHPGSSELPGKLLKIRPYKENDGIDAGANLLQTLHDVYIEGGENKSDSHAFEIWFDRGKFKFRMYAANPRAESRFKRRVESVYTNSEVATLDNCDALPQMDEGYYISGATLDENRHTFVPIRHHEGDGFPHGDPYSDILGEMATLDDSMVVLQVIFKPARHDWTENGPNGQSVDEVANSLLEGEVESLRNISAWLPWHEIEEYGPSHKDKQAAKLVREQRGKQGFHIDIRVLAASPNRREAIERARGVSRLFTNVYSGEAKQRLVDHPMPTEKPEALGFLKNMVYRRWVDHEMILSLDELAGIAHIPNTHIEVPQIPWKTTQTGEPVASDADKGVHLNSESDNETSSDTPQQTSDVDAQEHNERSDETATTSNDTSGDGDTGMSFGGR
ncbi:hypothetical protein [Halovenus marina]|uniref:hypothetical protein n=1 Tax=Halovenus marina TaxID=3396621 RepID=UPI003F54538D